MHKYSAGSRVLILSASGLILIGLVAGLWNLRSRPASGAGQLASRSFGASAIPHSGSQTTPVSPVKAADSSSGKATASPQASAPPELAALAPTTAPAGSNPAKASPTQTQAALTPAVNPSATPMPCNLALEGDPFEVSIPLNTRLSTGQAFHKTWELKNGGDCGWTDAYSLRWVSGSRLDAPGSVFFAGYTPPGESVQLSLDMVAPAEPGTYESRWMLHSSDGELFGVGKDNAPLVVRIKVTSPPTATPIPPVRITGRVVFSGTPVAAGLLLSLEDADQGLIATAQTNADGAYEFSPVAYDSRGYTLLFSQAENEQYEMSQVPSWIWLSKINPQPGVALQLPDLEISLLGFNPTSPEPDATISLATISSASPLAFTWTHYPQATSYWVDLVLGDENSPVWQSSLTSASSATFNGMINGTPAQPGEYWWTIGARRELSGGLVLSIYGYLIPLNLAP